MSTSRFRALTIGAALVLLSACQPLVNSGPRSDVVCTLEARPGLLVEVLDSLSGARVEQDVRVRATDGTYADTAAGGMGGRFALAYERAGTYTVSVTHPTYQPWSRSGVRVTRDECHVRTVTLTARLSR